MIICRSVRNLDLHVLFRRRETLERRDENSRTEQRHFDIFLVSPPSDLPHQHCKVDQKLVRVKQ